MANVKAVQLTMRRTQWNSSLWPAELELDSAAVAVSEERIGVEKLFNRARCERSVNAELLKTCRY